MMQGEIKFKAYKIKTVGFDVNAIGCHTHINKMKGFAARSYMDAYRLKFIDAAKAITVRRCPEYDDWASTQSSPTTIGEDYFPAIKEDAQ